jgi:acetyltransferase
MDNLENLFNPKSIAIVGATEEKGKVGNALSENILNLGYSGDVFLVNPKHQTLFEKKCYSALEEIEEDVDLAIIAIPAKFVSEVIKNASGKVKNFVIISAGFSEIGGEGAEREKEILEIAEKNNLNILGPNCLGFIIPKIKLNASFAGGLPKSGNISLVSQSGALITAFMDIFKSESPGFSNIISIGNKMQIKESDLFEYLAEDSETKVIGIYIEGIKDGKKFRELAQKISKIKPVVILKAGKTEKAQEAIMSHTGALAGSEEVIKALFEKTGVIQTRNLNDFLNTLKLISLADPPINENVAIITNAGGPGVLTTDTFSNKKIKLAEISENTKKELREFLPEESSVENPIDLLGDAQEDRYDKALEIIDRENVGSIVCVLTPQENTPVEKISEKIVEFKNKTKKPVAAVFLGGEKINKAADLFKKSGIPNFSFPEEAIRALDNYYKWNEARGKNREIEPVSGTSERKEEAAQIIKKVRSDVRSLLSFSESKELIDIYEINAVKYQEVNPNNELEIEFPMVMKVESDKIFHKTDKQGVILNIKDEVEFKGAYESISKRFPGEKIIIQPMQKIQTELIIGIKKDETVGPVVVFGLGGIYTEIFKMVGFLLPPANLNEIKEVIEKSPISFLFKKQRGQNPYNLDDIAKIISKVCLLAEEIKEIKELDINPLLIYNDERPSLAVDVKVII